MTESADRPSLDGVAIIALSCRFPGADNADEFWHNLRDGVESIRAFTDEELLSSGVNPELLSNPNYVKAGAVLEHIDLFDAPFFGFSAREAELMDPQHRLLLECAWEVLESAGYAPGSDRRRIGLFCGVGFNGYLVENLCSHRNTRESHDPFQLLISNDKDYVATRIAYKLNLRGPAIAIQTACSTSLVAVHLACMSLLNCECDVALAGAAAVKVPQKTGYLYQKDGIDSPDGHCRAFDARAEGTVRGNGVGLVLLKRLEDAIADGDRIRAVIRGSAINNDGASKVGYTAPSIDGEAEVVAESLAMAGFNADSIGYVEAHGTATAIGDPIEVAALRKVFGAQTSERQYCALGSVKTNIGHLDVAAGIAGLIKVVLALEHGVIPPSLHFEQPNPEIDFRASPFYVNTTLTPWPASWPRRASISSFGIGGTNAHIVIEEAPAQKATPTSSPCQLLLISAKTSEALEASTSNLAEYLVRKTAPSLSDAAYTLQVGRRVFDHRRLVVARSAEDAAAALATADGTRRWTAVAPVVPPSVAFLFPGSGTQHVDLARDLYPSQSYFWQQVDWCAEYLQQQFDLDLYDVLGELALFTTEFALARLLMKWGIHPGAVIGDGVGELVAACLAGALSVESALMLVAAGSNLLSALQSPVAKSSARFFANSAQTIELGQPRIPWISTISGTWISTNEAFPRDYWVKHPQRPSRLKDGLSELLKDPDRILLEVGPRYEVADLLKQCPDRVANRAVISMLPARQSQDSSAEALLTAIGKLWLSGVSIDWHAFHADAARQRVSLPTYPFERKRYWIDPKAPVHESAETSADRNRPAVADWFYFPSWRRSLPPPLAALPKPSDRAVWLIFEDVRALAYRLAERLEQAGHRLVRVVPGTEFKKLSERTCSLDPRRPEHYRSLIDGLRAAGIEVLNVVHGWSANPITGPSDGLSIFDPCQLEGFHSLMFLAQALGNSSLPRPVQITVLSEGLHNVSGFEDLTPARAPLLGICKVIPQEYPNITCRNIDIHSPPSSSPEEARLLENLLAEVGGPGTETQVAYRGSYRWIPAFEAIRSQQIDAARTPLRRHGVYLITGGFGGIGMTLARWLAREAQARLVLTGRSPLQPDDERIRELEYLGAEVFAAQADVSDHEQMHDVLQTTSKRFGIIHGVVHAAGVAGSGLIQLKTIETATRVLMPKIQGAMNLQKLLQDVPLDFFVMCSSITSILGGIGQVDYCAANAFLDSFAHKNNRQGARFISINWDAWQQVGMAANSPVPSLLEKWRAHNILGAITPAEGVEVFKWALSANLPQLVVSTRDLQGRLELSGGLAQSRQRQGFEERSGETPHPRPDLRTIFVQPRTPVERKLAETWQELLGFDKVGAHDDFFDLGGDSLLSVDMMSRIRREFEIDLTTDSLLEGTTVAALAAVIEEALLEKLETPGRHGTMSAD